MNIIVACCKNNGIGNMGKLAWHMPMELNYFKKITTMDKKNAIVVGNNTWQRDFYNTPLPKRFNIIFTQNKKLYYTYHNGYKYINTDDQLQNIVNTNNYQDVWILGGQKIYENYLYNNNVQYLFKTKIYNYYKCDVFFPQTPEQYEKKYTSKLFNDRGIRFNINIYENQDFNPTIQIENKPTIDAYSKLIDEEWTKNHGE